MIYEDDSTCSDPSLSLQTWRIFLYLTIAKISQTNRAWTHAVIALDRANRNNTGTISLEPLFSECKMEKALSSKIF